MSSPALAPSQPDPPASRRPLLLEMWQENRDIVKAITSDGLLWLLALLALLLAYLVLHAVEQTGYPHDRAVRIEEIHYWCYICVDVLFAVDLMMKLFVFLFLRKRSKSNG